MRHWLSSIAAATVVVFMAVGCTEDEEPSVSAVDPQITGVWCRLVVDAGPTGYAVLRDPATQAPELLTIMEESFVWGSSVSITAAEGFYAKDGDIGDSILGLRYHPLYWYSVVDAPQEIEAQALCIQSARGDKPASVTFATASGVFCRAADTTLWK